MVKKTAVEHYAALISRQAKPTLMEGRRLRRLGKAIMKSGDEMEKSGGLTRGARWGAVGAIGGAAAGGPAGAFAGGLAGMYTGGALGGAELVGRTIKNYRKLKRMGEAFEPADMLEFYVAELVDAGASDEQILEGRRLKALGAAYRMAKHIDMFPAHHGLYQRGRLPRSLTYGFTTAATSAALHGLDPTTTAMSGAAGAIVGAGVTAVNRARLTRKWYKHYMTGVNPYTGKHEEIERDPDLDSLIEECQEDEIIDLLVAEGKRWERFKKSVKHGFKDTHDDESREWRSERRGEKWGGRAGIAAGTVGGTALAMHLQNKHGVSYIPAVGAATAVAGAGTVLASKAGEYIGRAAGRTSTGIRKIHRTAKEYSRLKSIGEGRKLSKSPGLNAKNRHLKDSINIGSNLGGVVGAIGGGVVGAKYLGNLTGGAFGGSLIGAAAGAGLGAGYHKAVWGVKKAIKKVRRAVTRNEEFTPINEMEAYVAEMICDYDASNREICEGVIRAVKRLYKANKYAKQDDDQILPRTLTHAMIGGAGGAVAGNIIGGTAGALAGGHIALGMQAGHAVGGAAGMIGGAAVGGARTAIKRIKGIRKHWHGLKSMGEAFEPQDEFESYVHEMIEAGFSNREIHEGVLKRLRQAHADAAYDDSPGEPHLRVNRRGKVSAHIPVGRALSWGTRAAALGTMGGAVAGGVAGTRAFGPMGAAPGAFVGGAAGALAAGPVGAVAGAAVTAAKRVKNTIKHYRRLKRVGESLEPRNEDEKHLFEMIEAGFSDHEIINTLTEAGTLANFFSGRRAKVKDKMIAHGHVVGARGVRKSHRWMDAERKRQQKAGKIGKWDMVTPDTYDTPEYQKSLSGVRRADQWRARGYGFGVLPMRKVSNYLTGKGKK